MPMDHESYVSYRDAAMAQAREQMEGWAYPEDVEPTVRYPGVDPEGKYSKKEMEFADREARIREALSVRPKEVQDLVERFLASLQRNEGPREMPENGVQAAFNRMREHSRQMRLLSRGSKLCPDPEAAEYMKKELEDGEKSPEFQEYDRFLKGLEQLAGIDSKPLSPEMKEFFSDRLGAPLPANVDRLRCIPDRQPASFSVSFENFDHQSAQAFFSNPHNYGKKPADMPEDPLDLEAASGAVTRYAVATATRSLDPVFDKIENRLGQIPGAPDRGSLVIVDGKTVRERMQEEYNLSGSPEGFESWYRENLKQKSAEYVAAGLMAGKRVEAFVPDENGKLPQEPVQVTKEGYEPTPLKKVTLNAWERFMSRRGFYKEKTAAAAEYQAALEARERVHKEYADYRIRLEDAVTVRTNVRNLFYEPRAKELGDQLNGKSMSDYMRDGAKGLDISADRTIIPNLCVAYMVEKGHHLEDILDPNKLQQERLEAIHVCEEKTFAGDLDWVSDRFWKGSHKIMGEINRLTDGVNLRDPLVRTGLMPAIGLGTAAVFDIFQDCSRGKNFPAFCEAAKRDGSTLQQALDFYDHDLPKVGALSYLDKVISDRSTMRKGGELNLDDAIGRSMLQEIVLDKVCGKPGGILNAMPQFANTDPALSLDMVEMNAKTNNLVQAINDACEKDPAIHAKIRESYLSGELFDNMKPVTHEVKYPYKFKKKGWTVQVGEDGMETLQAKGEIIRDKATTAVTYHLDRSFADSIGMRSFLKHSSQLPDTLEDCKDKIAEPKPPEPRFGRPERVKENMSRTAGLGRRR